MKRIMAILVAVSSIFILTSYSKAEDDVMFELTGSFGVEPPVFTGFPEFDKACADLQARLDAMAYDLTTFNLIIDSDILPNDSDKNIHTVVNISIPDQNLVDAIEKKLSISKGWGITNHAMAKLTALYRASGGIKDLTGLEYAVNLNELYLDVNQITNISALSNLTNLTELYLRSNQITNISALSNLTNLNGLFLSDNQITDISALSNLTNLTYLCLSDNQITDISALSNLTNLTELELWSNQITDISALVSNAGLGEGDTVYLWGNALDLTPGSKALLDIQALKDRGVNVHYTPQKK